MSQNGYVRDWHWQALRLIVTESLTSQPRATVSDSVSGCHPVTGVTVTDSDPGPPGPARDGGACQAASGRPAAECQ
jgi:hypothetical protein